nr:MAG TPA: hypothetical protein [Caudoviricetes sp.]
MQHPGRNLSHHQAVHQAYYQKHCQVNQKQFSVLYLNLH